ISSLSQLEWAPRANKTNKQSTFKSVNTQRARQSYTLLAFSTLADPSAPSDKPSRITTWSIRSPYPSAPKKIRGNPVQISTAIRVQNETAVIPRTACPPQPTFPQHFQKNQSWPEPPSRSPILTQSIRGHSRFPIVNNDPHNRPQSILEHGAEIHLPAEQLVNDPILDAFRFTTSPRWTPAPRTKLLFWWGFVCPPLWLYGSLHLLPPLRRRLTRQKRPSNGNRRPRRGQILSYLSRLRGPYSKGDVEVGTTTVVVVPRTKTLYDDSCETVMISDWSPGCISSAERLDAAGINASEWLHPDARTEETLAELDKCERRGAYHCLLAFLLLSIIIVVSVIISQRVHWPTHTSAHFTSSENEPSMGNNNLLGASSHSSPL
ncbi:hypothetical protein MJO29_004069, partial [Puccinia striiformis f. sp. tritici]